MGICSLYFAGEALGDPRSTFPSSCLFIFLFKMPVNIVFGKCNAGVLERLFYN